MDATSMKSERQTRQDQIDLQLGRAGWFSGSRQLISELLVENVGIIRSEPEQLFKKPELDELIDLAQSLAA